MKKLLLLVAVMLIVCQAFSQSYYIIEGKVISAVTKEPLQGASVFAQNTTIGTATDAEGRFKIYLPDGGYSLIITYTGYNTENVRISNADAKDNNVVYELSQKEKQMEEVSVVATSEVKDGWVKYGQFFLDEFIGQTANSQQCTIKNKDAIHFYFSKKRNRLKVLATEPLQIENLSLGYNVRYDLDSFTHEYNTEVSLYTGYPLFEEMQSTDYEEQLKWMKARREAYKGSILHFMRSLYNETLQQEGFEVQFVVRNDSTEKALPLKNYYTALNYQKEDSTSLVEISPRQQRVGVIFLKEKPSPKFLRLHPGEPEDFQFSVLSFSPEDPTVIEQNGYYYEQNNISISAYWTWDKVADQLPYNYKPVSE